nr:Chain B, Nephrin [Mus musculus]
LPFELRGHLV